MKKPLVYIFILILVCGVGLSASYSFDRKSKQSITDEIIALEKASVQAWKHKDKKFYSEYWADDFTEFLPQSPKLTTDPKSNLLPGMDQSFADWNLTDLQ